MTYKEESYLLDTVAENNKLLNYIARILNTYIINHSRENEEDFDRNVLANLVSNMFAIERK